MFGSSSIFHIGYFGVIGGFEKIINVGRNIEEMFPSSEIHSRKSIDVTGEEMKSWSYIDTASSAYINVGIIIAYGGVSKHIENQYVKIYDTAEKVIERKKSAWKWKINRRKIEKSSTTTFRHQKWEISGTSEITRNQMKMPHHENISHIFENNQSSAAKNQSATAKSLATAGPIGIIGILYLIVAKIFIGIIIGWNHRRLHHRPHQAIVIFIGGWLILAGPISRHRNQSASSIGPVICRSWPHQRHQSFPLAIS